MVNSKEDRPKVIVITGPECSGKTTLATALSDQLNGTLVTEYAREYLEKMNHPYTWADLVEIGTNQLSQIQKAMANNRGIVIIDTWIFVLIIWAKLKFGRIPDIFISWMNLIEIDMYLLCTPTEHYTFDPLREHAEQRYQLYQIYLTLLQSLEVRFAVSNGTSEERLSDAVALIRDL